METGSRGEDLDLPCLDRLEHFRFRCGSDRACFNRCCAQLALLLTPYDILQLTAATSLSASEFLELHTAANYEDPSGIPLFYLQMLDAPGAPCPFVTASGCSVYAYRPGACRAYPLGRGSYITTTGVAERFFLINEKHCLGFSGGPRRTPGQWFEEQGLKRHNFFNDRFMRLQALIRATHRPLEGAFQELALLSLWRMDEFDNFVKQVNLAERVTGPLMDAFLATSCEGHREACLNLGFGWLELAIFGQAEGLVPR